MKGKLCKVVELDYQKIITPIDESLCDKIKNTIIPNDYSQLEIKSLIESYDVALSLILPKPKKPSSLKT